MTEAGISAEQGVNNREIFNQEKDWDVVEDPTGARIEEFLTGFETSDDWLVKEDGDGVNEALYKLGDAARKKFNVSGSGRLRLLETEDKAVLGVIEEGNIIGVIVDDGKYLSIAMDGFEGMYVFAIREEFRNTKSPDSTKRKFSKKTPSNELTEHWLPSTQAAEMASRLSESVLREMDPFKFEEFMREASRSADIAAGYLPAILDKFEEFNGLEVSQIREEGYRLHEINELLRLSLWGLSHQQVQLEPELIERMYQMMFSENEWISNEMMESLRSIVVLGEKWRGKAEYVNYLNRFIEDTISLTQDLGDDTDYRMLNHALRLFWAEFPGLTHDVYKKTYENNPEPDKATIIEELFAGKLNWRSIVVREWKDNPAEEKWDRIRQNLVLGETNWSELREAAYLAIDLNRSEFECDKGMLLNAILRAWSFANTRARQEPQSGFWDSSAADLYIEIGMLLSDYNVEKHLKRGRLIGSEHIESLLDEEKHQKGSHLIGVEHIESLFNVEGIDRAMVVQLLSYNMWLGWRAIPTAYSGGKELKGFEKEFADEYQRVTKQTLDAFSDYIRRGDGGAEEVHEIMLGLKNLNMHKEAGSLLMLEGVNDAVRLELVVGFINNFGYMNAIKFIGGAMSERANLPEDVKEALEKIYHKIQGDEATKILADYREVYEHFKISEWPLYSEGLTQREVEDTLRIAAEQGVDVRPDHLLMVDIGAGDGRLLLPFAERGFKVIGIDGVAHNVETINRRLTEVDNGSRAVEGNWLNLMHELGLKEESVDVVYSLGRSLPHNSDVNEVLRCFDEINRALKPGGIARFDYPKKRGVYQERAKKLYDNLSKLGVKLDSEGMVFGGVLDKYKYNRMLLDEQQVQSLAYLMGFEVVETTEEVVSEEKDIVNVYYTFKKREGFIEEDLERGKIEESLRSLLVFDQAMGADFDEKYSSWGGLSLGQIILFLGYGPDMSRTINYLKETNGDEYREIRTVVDWVKGEPYFESSGIPSGRRTALVYGFKP